MILKRDSKRIKELEEINEQHRKLNGKLRQEIDILESQLDFITYQNIVIENLQKEINKLNHYKKLYNVLKDRKDKALNYVKNKQVSAYPYIDLDYIEQILNGGADE